MHRRHLLPLLALLAASSASAQDGAESISLEGGSRISLQGGWRYAHNDTFYDGYYSKPENAGLERVASARGGPMVTATFAYSLKDSLEIGIDLFGTTQKMDLTGQPRLTTASYGAMIGLRYQTWLDLGPSGTVPFIGVLTGPLVAAAAFEGQRTRETISQAWAGAAGATMMLTPNWGLCLEYRFVLARGGVGTPEQRLGSFNAGGNWLSLGVTYTFAKQPASPFDRSF